MFSNNAKMTGTIIVLAAVAMTVNCYIPNQIKPIVKPLKCLDSEQCKAALGEIYTCWNGICQVLYHGRMKMRPKPLKCQTSGQCIAALGKDYICLNRICKKRPKSIKSRHPGTSI